MKSLCSFLILASGLPLAIAQENAEVAVDRDVRIIIAGSRPLPVFRSEDETTKEHDPSLDLIPPDAVGIPIDKKSDKIVSAPANTVARIAPVNSSSTLRLKLLNRLSPQDTPASFDCKLGDSLHPLIVLYRSRAEKAWDDPLSQVVNLDETTVPARSAVVLNLSPLPLKVTVDGKDADIVVDGNAVLPLESGEAPVRFRMSAVKEGKTLAIANSAYAVGKEARLIMLVMPDANSTSPSGLTMRLISDPVKAPK